MGKIKMSPIVEMDGDEMTRVLWAWIKEILLEPFIDLNTEYYDLGLKERDKTDDEITIKAANAAKRVGVAVKCATITPDQNRIKEYNLKRTYKSPNGTIRRILDGTVFRAPILAKGVKPYIPGWKKPIVIARHAYGDIYSAAEAAVSEGDTAYLLVEGKNGEEKSRVKIHSFSGGGIIQGVHNTDLSISAFARSCFEYALDNRLNILFGAKDTISKTYDGRFKELFNDIYQAEYAERFKEAGIGYSYTLIDDAVARAVRSEGGYLWVCKNYDGDVMSDMVATAYGSLGMMTSVLVSPDGKYEFEAAHGTVTRHYYRYLRGDETSTNSVATIFAWSGALKKRAQLDKNAPLLSFAKKLEESTVKTIESGYMTGDLLPLFERENVQPHKLNSREFLLKIAEKL